jgi:hypothetical protein
MERRTILASGVSSSGAQCEHEGMDLSRMLHYLVVAGGMALTSDLTYYGHAFADEIVVRFGKRVDSSGDAPATLHIQNGLAYSLYETTEQDVINKNTFKVYTKEEINLLVKDLQLKLAEASKLIVEQTNEINKLKDDLVKRIDALPKAIAADKSAVNLLQTQMEAEFDRRYLKTE